ncbi:hypothetical protein D9619_002922 [Psilocybe cf. subviscida]|uniref:Membrane-associated proteins in eicosanoid and glutathione metabolism n=1 Tax=Psilocybe cf. subviscida TaxID=2480587 RepID=A0A8H5ETZ8_9AGAR|nr:hypothetical protein D9619_002922 [Psilocybe cf. subviscida]
MSVTVTLPEGFQYVGSAVVSTVLLLLIQSNVVGRYRKRAGIKYPQLYAENAQVEKSADALKFNCAQRAHQNTLEYIPIAYVTTLVTATKFPVFAAGVLGWWSLSRIAYTRGYVTGDPQKRVNVIYISGSLGLLSSLVVSTYLAGGWLWEGISKLL